MQKNVAGQKIGGQMITAADGTAFTGTVTVYVTGDAGTQALGSVGSGVCTHEGNGYHTYAPAQAETNYDLIAFTFIGTGAIPATVQIYTRYDASVTHWIGTAASTPTVAGVPNVNVKTWNDLVTVALPLVPTTAGRTLDVSTGGEAGVDWANVGSPTTTVGLTGTTIATTQKVDVETIKMNPVVNAGTITFPTGATLASTSNITAGTITTTTNLTNLPTMPTDWLTAAGLAADAVTEIQSGLATAANLATVAGYLDTEIAAILVDTDEIQQKLSGTGAVTLASLTVTGVLDVGGTITLTGAVQASSSTNNINVGKAGGVVMHSGTATTAGAQTIRIPAGTETDPDVYLGSHITMYSGDGVGQTRTLKSYDGPSLTYTIDRPWYVVPSTSMKFVIRPADNPALSTGLSIALVDTTTTNTDMRGTDNAATAAALASLVTTVGAAGAGLTEAGGTGDQLTAVAWNAAWDAEVQSEVTDALNAALTEAYRSAGATGSVAQLLYEIIAHLGEFAIASTTKTTKKLDGTTTAKTYTLDSATTPTSITEAT